VFSIPFNQPSFFDSAYDYIRQVVQVRHHSGDGNFTKKCHRYFEETLGVSKALLTTSCTHALEMAALLLHLQPGDEVIVPSFTFVSTANAFALRGVRLVFSDVRPDTLNLDEELLPSLITSRTRPIVPVHYAGIPCEMDAILSIATAHKIPVVEDNAHGLFAQHRGRFLGTFGCLATQSFHETKNISCGEGGALLINDPSLADRAEILREKGTNRSRFFRGQVDKYTWVDLGSSYLPSELLAAVLYSQLERSQFIQARRRQLWLNYASGLDDWARDNGVRLPIVPTTCDQAYHMFYLIFPDLEQRQAFIAHMRAQGICSVFHYLPLHLSNMGQTFGGYAGQCPITEAVSDRLTRLPLFYDLSEQDQSRVIRAIQSFRGGRADVRTDDPLDVSRSDRRAA